MNLKNSHIVASLLLFISALSTTIAHSDSHDHDGEDGMMDMMVDAGVNQTVVPVPHEPMHMHGIPILENPHLTAGERLYWENYNTTTFFTLSTEIVGSKKTLWFHTWYIGILTVFLYPILLSLNNIDNGWYLLVLSVNYVVLSLSCLSLWSFHKSLQRANIDLYPGNIFQILTVILFVLFSVHFISALVKNYSNQKNSSGNRLDEFSNDNDNDTNGVLEMSEFGNEMSPSQTLRNSHDIHSTRSNSNNTLTASNDKNVHSNNNNNKKLINVKRDQLYEKIYSVSILQKIVCNFSILFKFLFNLLNYPIMLYLLVYCGMGLAIGNLYGTPNERIFNILAHWIKGGVFFVLGLVSLSRYCGFGIDKSWAWNATVSLTNSYTTTKILSKKSWWSKINMEFIESFLIFFYGSTNVFLEHLASKDGKWTPKDLQHVSIAFMYIGGGLCGLLVEYYMIDWKREYTMKNYQRENGHEQEQEQEQEQDSNIAVANPGFSPNPFPAFTIFWTGLLMSKHAQASAISTAIHIQWGNLLTYGSFFRIITIFYMYCIPLSENKPARPLTELITSFCLLCGGLIFMESTDQVIEGMEYRGFTEMFTFNLSVGVITLLMAWIMSLFIWKDWLKKRSCL